MGSQVEKLETDVYIKASAEQFHDVLCRRTHHIVNVCPDKVQGVQIHDGEWGTEGSIIFCNYSHGGKEYVVKEMIESIDTENNKVTFKVLEGDLTEHYKNFRFKIHVEPQEERGTVVHWSMEYEKLKDHIADPHSLQQMLIDITKDIDDHLVTQDDQKSSA